MRIFALAAPALLAVGISTAPASAVPIAPMGTTDITASEGIFGFLGDDAITPSPIPPATMTFSFPITGGETDPLLVTHSGGLRFATGDAFLEATDFVINAATGIVAGSVFGSALWDDPAMADLFTLDNVASSNGMITADLLITDTLNMMLGLTFADPVRDLGLTGAVFGSAETGPMPIPLPASASLLIGGIAMLGLARRRSSMA
jgi:hypothetical protein